MIVYPRSSLIENLFHHSRFFVLSWDVENFSFYPCEELSWNFDGNCIECADCIWKDRHFYHVNPTDT